MKTAAGSDRSRLFINRDISKRMRTEEALRMIELKNEINALCATACQPPRHVLDFAEDPA